MKSKRILILITLILYFLCALFFYSSGAGILFTLLMSPFLLLGLALLGAFLLFLLVGVLLLLGAILEASWNTWKSLREKYRGKRKSRETGGGIHST